MTTPQHFFHCPLCREDGGLLVMETAHWRIVRVLNEIAFPAFYRLISRIHAVEWTDLPETARKEGWRALEKIEKVLREQLNPIKINWANLGNQVPHVHVHVIARFEQDTHFPQAVWGTAERTINPLHFEEISQKLLYLDAAIHQVLSDLSA
jgi:diadenosine tetraphosphate (Ap4A) HIT family hydrolase